MFCQFDKIAAVKSGVELLFDWHFEFANILFDSNFLLNTTKL